MTGQLISHHTPLLYKLIQLEIPPLFRLATKATKWSSSRFISTTTTSAAWLKFSRVELEWQILCESGWRMNYLLFACLMVQTKATKWSNTGTLPPTATVATEPTATVACLHWLTNQMLKTWAGCTTEVGFVFSVLDSQVFLVLNQCCLQFALKVCYLDLLRHGFVACLEIVAMGVFAIVDLYQQFVTSCDRECQRSWNYRSCSHSSIELDTVDAWRFDRICCYAGCVWHVHAYLVLRLYTCSFVHMCYMCAVWTFICMLRTHAQRAMALSSCLIQGNQVVKLKVHFHNKQPQLLDWSPSMADFVWKWLKNELPTVLVCLPDGANQGNKVVKHRDPTPPQQPLQQNQQPQWLACIDWHIKC